MAGGMSINVYNTASRMSKWFVLLTAFTMTISAAVLSEKRYVYSHIVARLHRLLKIRQSDYLQWTRRVMQSKLWQYHFPRMYVIRSIPGASFILISPTDMKRTILSHSVKIHSRVSTLSIIYDVVDWTLLSSVARDQEVDIPTQLASGVRLLQAQSHMSVNPLLRLWVSNWDRSQERWSSPFLPYQ